MVVVEDLKRETEGSKFCWKEKMTTQRAWAWDQDEMKKAAMMDHPTLDQISEQSYPTPIVSGFTPINQHSNTALIFPEHNDAATKPTTADKLAAQKRRKTQPSAATTATKPKRAASAKKTRKAKTAAQLDNQNVSQGLSRTKPTSSWHGALRAKAGSFIGDSLLEQIPGQRSVGATPLVYETQSARSGLGDRYQAAYPTFRDNVVNEASPPTPPKSDEVEAEDHSHKQLHDQDSTTGQQVNMNVNLEPIIEENAEVNASIIYRDFGVPPFTQVSPAPIQDPSSPKYVIPNKILKSGDSKHRGQGSKDEFPMDDECLEEMMQTMASPAKEETSGLDWRRQDLSDDVLWSEVIPDSDEAIIYNENTTIVMSDVIDVPSSPPRNSQSPGILSHVSGNTSPHRARLSQGSENCFNDHDLDDGLTDLVVDESKSLQLTSPVTPEKRSLSPKLQWLPPKTYRPSKMSQIPVSLTDDPHVVPANVNNDVLPFIRPPFPKAVRDRSPILGLNNRTVLRVCFRIGEALNAAAVASRANVDAVIELYARVASSSREANGGYKQSFQFADLFTDKPPCLSGTYTLWKGVALWDNDSKELVGEPGGGKMVRVLGRIKRKQPVQGQGPGVEMVVLSIWEADWEEVEVAKGVICHTES